MSRFFQHSGLMTLRPAWGGGFYEWAIVIAIRPPLPILRRNAN